MYKRLAKALKHTRHDLYDVCLVLGIDPEEIDTNLLGIYQCDDCGLWDAPHTMHVLNTHFTLCNTCYK